MKRSVLLFGLVAANSAFVVACQGGAAQPAKPLATSSASVAPTASATAQAAAPRATSSTASAAPVVGDTALSELAKFEAFSAESATQSCPDVVARWESAKAATPLISAASSREITASLPHATRRRVASDTLMTKLMACKKSK